MTRASQLLRALAWTITVGVAALTVAALVVPASIAAWFAPIATPDEVRATIQRAGPLAWAAYVALWILQAVLAPLPAFALTLAGGALFGFWPALFLTTTGAMAGAALTYVIGRALRRKPPSGTRAERLVERWGAWAILALRLVPLFPFDPVSYAAGYFRVPAGRFFLATFAGMLPATVVLTLIGSGKVRDAMYWPIFAVTALVWVLAIAGGALYLRRRRAPQD